MRVNIYAEELTARVEVIEKPTEGKCYYGLRLYLELPISVPSPNGTAVSHRGPFIHKMGDDDSAAVTFWADSLDELENLSIRLNSAVRRRLNRLSMDIDTYGKKQGQ